MDIDFVVLWVDGNDPAWQEEKAKYSPKKVDDSNNQNRYRDWGLMPYWFRAIEAYTPWVRKIHFVTWGHVPAFLNTNHPKLHIVRHDEFIPKQYLPTFSSHTIEMNIHRIEGLAEHFVYFNDDMFITKNLPESYFFQNGVPCSYYTEIPLAFCGEVEVWQNASVNNLCIINNHFRKNDSIKKNFFRYVNYRYALKDNIRSMLFWLAYPGLFTGFKNFHSPAAYKKATFRTVWDLEPAILDETCSHRFRNIKDVNQWLALWWQLASGDFIPNKMKCSVFLPKTENYETTCKAITEKTYDMICINDAASDDYEFVAAKIIEAFEEALPKKSSFEK